MVLLFWAAVITFITTLHGDKVTSDAVFGNVRGKCVISGPKSLSWRGGYKVLRDVDL